MLIVVPISKSDAHLASSLVKVLKALGGMERFDALVISAQDIRSEACDFADAISKPLFKSVEYTPIVDHCRTGWPQGPNDYFFKSALSIIPRYFGNTLLPATPWFWFELDNTPLVPGWAQTLVAEYEKGGKPFMGVKVPTTRVMADGTISTEGEHMMGSGIYPPDLSTYCKLLRYADAEPWDCFCQYEIVPHMHATDLIQHNWGSQNYRRTGATGGVIRCNYRTMPTHPTLSYVRKEAVLLHGCKDDSLRNVVLEKYG